MNVLNFDENFSLHKCNSEVNTTAEQRTPKTIQLDRRKLILLSLCRNILCHPLSCYETSFNEAEFKPVLSEQLFAAKSVKMYPVKRQCSSTNCTLFDQMLLSKENTNTGMNISGAKSASAGFF